MTDESIYNKIHVDGLGVALVRIPPQSGKTTLQMNVTSTARKEVSIRQVYPLYRQVGYTCKLESILADFACSTRLIVIESLTDYFARDFWQVQTNNRTSPINRTRNIHYSE